MDKRKNFIPRQVSGWFWSPFFDSKIQKVMVVRRSESELCFCETEDQRLAWPLAVYADAMSEALAKDYATGRGQRVYNANTYSGTLITSYLLEGSLTDLTNTWAFMNAYSIAKDTDPEKPLAGVVFKHVTGGEATQINPTNFEPAGGSTVVGITMPPAWYSQPLRVSATDVNDGARLDDLREKALATFSDTVVQAATAPITAANFTGTPVIRSFSTFNLSDVAQVQGQLAKSPIKNLILNGNYFSRISNVPGFIQKTGEDDYSGYSAYGWNKIYPASNWTGAGANINGFACNPQALVRATGVPAVFPAMSPINTTTFTLPGSRIVVQMNSWFNNTTRTFFASFDLMAAFGVGDASAGFVIATGTPS